MIYLDNAATTPMLPCVKAKLKELIDADFYGNPSSSHEAGEKAASLIEAARESVRRMFNAREDDAIIFTSGATEGNNIVSRGGASPLHLSGSVIEHVSVKNDLDYKLPVDENGVIGLCELRLKGDICGIIGDMFSLMLANNETGAIQPVREAAKICHDNRALIHTDATAAAGHILVDFQELDVDYLTFSGHKFGAPMGTGAIIAKVDAAERLYPLFSGGRQEYCIRPGTQNVLGIAGLGEAAKWYSENIDWCEKRLAKLRFNFINTLDYYGAEFIFNFAPKNIDSILNIRFPGVLANTLVGLLSADGICISTGSACHSGELKPSHVLKAMGQTDEEALSTVRVSFGVQNTLEEVEEAARKIAEKVRILRRMA